MKTVTYNPTRLDAWWANQQTADRREWTRVSAEVGDYIRDLAEREDLIAVVEPGVAEGNLAVWIPERAELRVDTDLCAKDINPADVHLGTMVGRLAHPALAGGCIHEGSHALASKWALDQAPAKRRVVQAALLLEEARAEKAMIEAHPEVRTFLRAGFHTLVKGEGVATDINGAARLAALGMARVDAGVLEADEMADVKAELVAVLGEELYTSLRAVWRRAQGIGNWDQARMEALGQEWLDLLPEEEGGEGGIDIIVCGMPGKPGEGEGEGGEGALGKAAQAIKADAEAEAGEQVEAAKAHDVASSRTKEANENRKAEQEAAKVFQFGHGHSTGGNEGVSGHVDVPVHVRAMGNQLATAIRKAQHRERSMTVVASVTPPGRLRGSAAVQRAAQRSQGQEVTAAPWRQAVRKHVDNPPIRCGVMMDVSGSMRWAEKPVAEAAWAIGHAIQRNDGDFATVAYGNRVHAVVAPGSAPRQMPVLNAGGGSEVPVQAARALDGALGLSNGTGVRMLVIISDGVYTGAQREGFTTSLHRLTKSGVKVLWIDMDSHGSDPIRMKGVEVVKVGRGTTDLGKVIGAAMTKALSAA